MTEWYNYDVNDSNGKRDNDKIYRNKYNENGCGNNKIKMVTMIVRLAIHARDITITKNI